MPFPRTDTKLMKRLPNDHFSFETIKDRADCKPSICTSCGRGNCKTYDEFHKTGARAMVSIRTCIDFIPVISFSVLKGLDQPTKSDYMI